MTGLCAIAEYNLRTHLPDSKKSINLSTLKAANTKAGRRAAVQFEAEVFSISEHLI